MAKLFLPKLGLAVIVIVILLSLFLIYSFFYEYYKAAQSLDPQVTKQTAAEQWIYNLKIKALAKKLGVFPTAVQESAEKVFLTKNKQDELKDIAWDFGRFVVMPSAIKARLAIKYYADRESGEANDILGRIRNGDKFEDIAKVESDDKVTGQFGGDMGFFERGDILPELESQIIAAPMGRVFDQVVVSRLGYHIIYPVETAEVDGATKWHAKHILIQTSGFDEWLASQI